MNATDEVTFALNDLVTVLPGFFPASVSTSQPYRIVKVPTGAREVNFVAQPVGGGRGLRAPAYAFAKFEGEVGGETPTAVPWTPPPALLEVGQIVTVRHPKFRPTDLYVVVAHHRDGKGNRLVKVGGDGGRYWPAIPTALCDVVEVVIAP